MQSTPRRLIALLIIAAGVSCALLFRRSDPPEKESRNAESPAAVGVAWHKQDFTLEVTDSAEISPAHSLYLDAEPAGNRGAEGPGGVPEERPAANPASLENVRTPPELPPSYDPGVDSGGAAAMAPIHGAVLGLPTADPLPSPMVSVTDGPAASAPPLPDAQTVAAQSAHGVPRDPPRASSARRDDGPRTVLIRHRVVDGDSLERLAYRYLGDRRRWPEIFSANADVLRHPDILPIGIEIVIRRERSPE